MDKIHKFNKYSAFKQTKYILVQSSYRLSNYKKYLKCN